MNSLLTKALLILFATSVLASCAATSLVDSWRNPNLSAEKLHKILVVSVTKNNAYRRLNEDVLATELRQRGIEAVPGYTMISGDDKADLQTLEKAVDAAGADGVLTVQTIKVQQKAAISLATSPTIPVTGIPLAFPAWNLYGYYGSIGYYEPPYVTTWEVATIQVSLFDAGSGKLRWAGTVQSSEPEKNIALSKDLARIVAAALMKEGVI